MAVRCTAEADTSRWMVTFGSFTDKPDLESPGFGADYLASRGISSVSVTCAGNDWYQYDDMPTALAAIRARVTGADRVMTYGSSMGAYAAIRFADAVGANACLALSPQYSNDRRKVPFEWRWGPQSRAIRWRPELDGPIRCGFAPVLIFDTQAEDGQHARRIARDIPIVAVPLPFTAHPATTYLNTAGLLDGVVTSVLDGTFEAAPFIAAARASRGQHAIYVAELGARQPVWRPRLGLALAREAVRLAPGYEVVAHMLARRLSDAGEHAEALLLHEQVVRSSGGSAGYALPYSEALAAAGETERALAVARTLAAEHPHMAHLQGWCAHLLWTTGAMDAAIVQAQAARRAAPSHWRYRKLAWHYRWRRLRARVLSALRVGAPHVANKGKGHA